MTGGVIDEYYSTKPKAELNNGMFSTRAEPKLKTCCYFALMSYVTIEAARSVASYNRKKGRSLTLIWSRPQSHVIKLSRKSK